MCDLPLVARISLPSGPLGLRSDSRNPGAPSGQIVTLPRPASIEEAHEVTAIGAGPGEDCEEVPRHSPDIVEVTIDPAELEGQRVTTREKAPVNFPTKRDWHGKSHISDIRSGLRALVADVRRLGMRSIAMPPLGRALGGLDWRKVRPTIEQRCPNYRMCVLLFDPAGTPDAKGIPGESSRRPEE